MKLPDSDALRRVVDDFEREVGKLGDDPASLALLYADSWDYPYTMLDVARCAVALDRSRKRPGAGRTTDPALDYLRERACRLRDGGLPWKEVAALLAIEIAEGREPERYFDGLDLDDEATGRALAKLAGMTEAQIEAALRR